MKHKLFVAFSATVFSIAVVISIASHCGSTWVFQAPTFGPTLDPNGCTAAQIQRRLANQLALQYIGLSVRLQLSS